MNNTFTCKTCQEEKCASHFPLKTSMDKKYPRHICLECRKDKARQALKDWKKKHPHYIRDKNREYRKENPQKIREKERIRSAKRRQNPKNQEYMKEYRLKNKEKYKSLKKKWKEKNKDKFISWSRANYRKKMENSPEKFIIERIRRGINTAKKQKYHSNTALFYTGCQSVEQLLFELSSRTDNPNWIQDGYEIDHIWQINWFSDYVRDNAENVDKIDEVMVLINHYSNLRPLSKQQNNSRPKNDFSPLRVEDFEKFKPFLNQGVLEKIEKHFNR